MVESVPCWVWIKSPANREIPPVAAVFKVTVVEVTQAALVPRVVVAIVVVVVPETLMNDREACNAPVFVPAVETV
jgi:hypothetical protein